MLSEAARRHALPTIRWIEDNLPGLVNIYRLDLAFDFILVSAVWMHLRAEDRRRAFRKFLNLLKPGGTIAITCEKGLRRPPVT